MTAADKEAWLGGYRASVDKWDSLNLELQAAYSRATNTAACIGGDGGKPGGRGPSKSEVWAERSQELAAQIEGRIAETKARMVDIEAAIDALRPAEWATLMRYRYINGFTVHEAAARVGYSDRQAQRILLAALEAIEVPGGD